MSKSDLLEPTGSVRWKEANFVAGVNAPQMVSNPEPLQELWPWFKSVRLYYKAETEQIARGAPTESELQSQKHMLAVLINVGEWLVRELRQKDVTDKLGVSLADVEATLDELHVSLRVLLGGMTEARREQILDEVFSAA